MLEPTFADLLYWWLNKTKDSFPNAPLVFLFISQHVHKSTWESCQHRLLGCFERFWLKKFLNLNSFTYWGIYIQGCRATGALVNCISPYIPLSLGNITEAINPPTLGAWAVLGPRVWSTRPFPRCQTQETLARDVFFICAVWNHVGMFFRFEATGWLRLCANISVFVPGA